MCLDAINDFLHKLHESAFFNKMLSEYLLNFNTFFSSAILLAINLASAITGCGRVDISANCIPVRKWHRIRWHVWFLPRHKCVQAVLIVNPFWLLTYTCQAVLGNKEQLNYLYSKTETQQTKIQFTLCMTYKTLGKDLRFRGFKQCKQYNTVMFLLSFSLG